MLIFWMLNSRNWIPQKLDMENLQDLPVVQEHQQTHDEVRNLEMWHEYHLRKNKWETRFYHYNSLFSISGSTEKRKNMFYSIMFHHFIWGLRTWNNETKKHNCEAAAQILVAVQQSSRREVLKVMQQMGPANRDMIWDVWNVWHGKWWNTGFNDVSWQLSRLFWTLFVWRPDRFMLLLMAPL